MIQELLTGSMEDRKLQAILPTIPLPVSSPTTTTSSSSPAAAAAATAEPLRCPRCDSSNTKFCYYNNYNLTQPRHFCKTCRRYWTKGGALRNVPIGGGCRKAKPPTATSFPSKSPSSAAGAASKPKLTSSDLFHSSSSSPLFWANSQNTTAATAHLLSLLRPNNSNNILNSVRLKEDGDILGINAALNAQSLSLYPSSTPYSSYHNNNNSSSNPTSQPGRDLLLGDVAAGSGMHELYQVIKSNSGSTNNYYNDQLHAVIGSNAGCCFGSSRTSSCSSIDTSLVSTSSAMVGNGNGNGTAAAAAAAAATITTTTSASILEPISFMGGDQFGGCWNHTATWADLSTTNGAFP